MANITKVILLSVPLEKDYAHTLYFASKSAQHTYFSGKAKKTYTDFSYQRKDNTIRVPEHVDTLYNLGCNYVMYQNTAYSDKWFYAFITDMKYLNDERTEIAIQTDCIQTWMFDINVLPSFVDREHVARDIMEDTLPEGLETGEYVVEKKLTLNIGDDTVIVAAITKTPDGLQAIGGRYHGIYSGLAYVPFNPVGASLQEFLKAYDTEAAADAISMLFLAPAALAQNNGELKYGEVLPHTAEPYKVIINKPTSDWGTFNSEVVGQFSDGTVDGYTPRNKKLLCYPYRYLLASNNAGGGAIYKFERFFVDTDDGFRVPQEPSFICAGCLTPGCSIRLIPQNYNGIGDNDEEGLNMGKYPTLNWTSDAYTNWLTQNSVNIGIDIVSGVGQIIGGAAVAIGSGGLGAAVGGGSIVGGVSTIANTVAQMYQQSLVPPQSRGNTNSGDIVTAMGDNEFKFYVMTITKEYARVIDEYFDMFGYKCHRVKVPAKDHRSEYWYTKTVDANISGAIPQGDLQTIKDCYNRGITFWKNPANFRNYSVRNKTADEMD